MRFYRFVTFDEVTATGKISAQDLQAAIDSRKIRVITHYSPIEQHFLTEEQLHRVLGLDVGLEPK